MGKEVNALHVEIRMRGVLFDDGAKIGYDFCFLCNLFIFVALVGEFGKCLGHNNPRFFS